MTKLPTIEVDPEEMARVMRDMIKDSGPPGPSDPGITAQEYAEVNSIGHSTARSHLYNLLEQGLVVKGQRWIRRQGDGNWHAKPVFRPKDKTEEKGGEKR